MKAHCKHDVIRSVFYIVLLLVVFVGKTNAGGSGENLIIVVNGQSQTSRYFANHYAKLRQVPRNNIIVLDEVRHNDPLGVVEFRAEILQPIFDEIRDRGLGHQIDYIVYSADIPTSVDVRYDKEQLDVELPQIYTRVASINGMTYLYQLALQGNAAYMQLEVNHYYQPSAIEALETPIPGDLGQPFTDGISQVERGTYADAIDSFLEFESNYPNHPSTAYWLAIANMQLGNSEDAQAYLTKAIDEGWRFRDYMMTDAAFESVRNEAWFQSLTDRLPPLPRSSRPTLGFSSAFGWKVRGMRSQNPRTGAHYVLSSVLGTTIHGLMSEEEVVAMLQRSVDADFTHPDGTFYFSNSPGVRTATRQPGFENAIIDLERLGHRSEVITDVLPQNRDDVLGLMLGTSHFDWPASGSNIVAGAICENLTSTGGVLYREENGQTRFTELLRGGATSSSGTVTEPYAIQNKFPHPHLQVHYARGATMAEAFYQSVHGPYQLLIMGDPLCQPFADRPDVTIEGITANQTLADPTTLRIVEDPNSAVAVGMYDVFIDGILIARLPIEQEFAFDPASLNDGYHEIRIVAIADNEVQTKNATIIPFQVEQDGHSVNFQLEQADANFALADSIAGQINAANASTIRIYHGAELLFESDDASASFSINASKIGRGTSPLIAVATINGQAVMSKPIEITIVD